MASAVVAIFDEYNEAQGAVNELLMNGFEKNQIKLSGEEKGTPMRGDGRPGGGVAGFFKSLFGKEQNENEIGMYSEAIQHGNFVLTAIAPTEEKSAVASEVMSHHHPIDLDQRTEEFDTRSAAENQTIPVVEEELKVGKRSVQRGGIRVFQRVTETPIEEQLDLKEEKVTVERRPVNQPVDASTKGAFKEGSFEVRETAEEPVVAKSARVVEEVRIGKETSQRKETVRDTVRKSDVEVQQLDAEEGYRSHWQQNFASEGRYEDYQPSYQFGAELADKKRYRGKMWNDAEPEIRKDWETKYPGGAWEKFKASIRHAFEKVKR